MQTRAVLSWKSDCRRRQSNRKVSAVEVENVTRYADGVKRVEAVIKRIAVSPWVERLAKLGFASKGVVYLLVGFLTVMAAIDVAKHPAGTRAAFRTIVAQPFGRFLLASIAVGLVGFILRRFVQVFVEPPATGREVKRTVRIAKRIGYCLSGLAHIIIAATVLQLMLGLSIKTRDRMTPTQDWTTFLMAQPFGRWLVLLAGLVVIGVGLGQFYLAYTERFSADLKLDEMNERAKRWTMLIGRVGFAARGAVFQVIGFFLIQAARTDDPMRARGLGGALQILEQQPYGAFVLIVVAVGFMAYGVYMTLAARYLRLIAAH